jgi:hypothetical protein
MPQGYRHERSALYPADRDEYADRIGDAADAACKAKIRPGGGDDTAESGL